jgi:hypothetical protein
MPSVNMSLKAKRILPTNHHLLDPVLVGLLKWEALRTMGYHAVAVEGM